MAGFLKTVFDFTHQVRSQVVIAVDFVCVRQKDFLFDECAHFTTLSRQVC